MSELKYVSAIDAKIYVNGILIDDIYDLQYTYRESKEPIYGYNSKYFDAVVPGNVIVHGSFSINYKHDAYLYSILEKTEKDMASVTIADNRIKTAEQYNREYTKLLYDFREINGKIKAAEINLKQSIANREGQERISSANSDAQYQNLNLKSEAYAKAYNSYDNLKGTLTEEEAEFYDHLVYLNSVITNTDDPAEYQNLNLRINDILLDYPNIKAVYLEEVKMNAALKDYEAQLEIYENELSTDSSTLTTQKTKELKSQAALTKLKEEKADLIKQLQEKKNALNNIGANWDNLSVKDAVTTSKKQPEDMRSFNIFIRFHNMNHVILESCYLTNHALSCSIADGSTPIKEYYSFIGQRAS